MQSGFQIILLSQNLKKKLQNLRANDEFRSDMTFKKFTKKHWKKKKQMTRRRYMEIHVESKNPLRLHLSFTKSQTP